MTTIEIILTGICVGVLPWLGYVTVKSHAMEIILSELRETQRNNNVLRHNDAKVMQLESERAMIDRIGVLEARVTVLEKK